MYIISGCFTEDSGKGHEDVWMQSTGEAM